MKSIPWLLVLSRAAIAPCLLWDAIDGQTSSMFIILYIWAFVSDIFDGIIARKLQVSTASLRIADSLADTALYISLAVCTWIVHPEVVLATQIPLLITIAAIAIWMIINFAKYGKLASYHTYSAKIWGISLFAATIGISAHWHSVTLLSIACLCGILNITEEIAITLLLPTWHHDILSLAHARHLITTPKLSIAPLPTRP
jgi:phosphatidylglycerophosphate synthase